MQQVRQNTTARQRSRNPAPPNAGRPQGGAVPRQAPKPKKQDITPAAKRKKKKDPNRVRFFSLQGRIDVPMLVVIMVLLVLGITMMFSAGHALSYQDNKGDSFYYVTRQMTAAFIGLAGMFLLTLFDYRFLRHEFTLFNHKITFAHILLVFTMILNLLTIPFGIEAVGGQKRWLPLPIMGQFQPSDFLKIAVIIYLAYYIHKHSDVLRKFFYGMVRPGMLFLVIIAVIMSQKHLSCLLIIFMTIAIMLFVGGVNIKPAIPVCLVAVVAIVVAIQFSGADYFGTRIKYMDPLSDPDRYSYQNYQSALAVGSGGIWGKGFGNSTQKYYYLPEAQNDFVYAVLVEEFGLIGGLAVILMFIIFVMRGFYIARRSEDKFGCLVATGITFQLGLQALLNIAVNLCCIPNTGVSLPFFSYGGTALMLQLWEMGLLLSISKRAQLN